MDAEAIVPRSRPSRLVALGHWFRAIASTPESHGALLSLAILCFVLGGFLLTCIPPSVKKSLPSDWTPGCPEIPAVWQLAEVPYVDAHWNSPLTWTLSAAGVEIPGLVYSADAPAQAAYFLTRLDPEQGALQVGPLWSGTPLFMGWGAPRTGWVMLRKPTAMAPPMIARIDPATLGIAEQIEVPTTTLSADVVLSRTGMRLLTELKDGRLAILLYGAPSKPPNAPTPPSLYWVIHYDPLTQEFDAPIQLQAPAPHAYWESRPGDLLLAVAHPQIGGSTYAFDAATGDPLPLPVGVAAETSGRDDSKRIPLPPRGPTPRGFAPIESRLTVRTPPADKPLLLPEVVAAHSYAVRLRGRSHPWRDSFNDFRLSVWRKTVGSERLVDRAERAVRVERIWALNAAPDGAPEWRLLEGDLALTSTVGSRWLWRDPAGDGTSQPSASRSDSGYARYDPRPGIRVFSLSTTDSLILQTIPESPLSINDGRGLFRLGTLHRSETEVHWVGWLRLPPGVDATTDPESLNVGILALDNGLMLGLTCPAEGVQDGSSTFAAWTRIPIPDGITTARRGNLSLPMEE